MNLDKFNKWLTLLTNLGVLAGIIFLGMELQQNSRMMQAQTRDALTGRLSDFFMDVGSNEYASDVFFRGRRGEFERGIDPEWDPFMFLVLSNLQLWENEWYQYQAGLFGEDEFKARSVTWGSLMRRRGYRQIWESTNAGYVQGFRDYIDSMLDND